MTDSAILQTLAPVTHDLGGFKVHRTLSHQRRTMVGPFIFFDQMGPAHLSPGDGIESARIRTSTLRRTDQRGQARVESRRIRASA